MRKSTLFSIAGGLVLLTLLVVVLVTGVVRKARLDAGSRDLAIAVTEAVFTADSGTLAANAHPDLLVSQPAQELASYIAYATRNLGTLERILSIRGESKISLLPFAGSAATADYVIDLLFTRESAEILIGMRREGTEWKITAFTIQATALME